MKENEAKAIMSSEMAATRYWLGKGGFPWDSWSPELMASFLRSMQRAYELGRTNAAATGSTEEALDMLEDVSARARAMNLGLVAYPVEDVEAVCAALRAVRGKSRAAIQPLT